MEVNKKTIALLTFHSAKSYGAVLQTYALSTYLENSGYKVILIDLRPPAITNLSFLRPGSWITAISFGRFEQKYFKKHPKVHKKINSLKHDPPIADYYIVGSDQVWNPEITKEFLLHYFFDFLPSEKKTISYAASFGKEVFEVNDAMKDNIKSLLAKFKAVSVREASGVSICENILGVNAEQVVDPTLLLSDYSNLTGEVEEKKHIICFKFVKNNKFYSMLRELSERIGMSVKILDSCRKQHSLQVIPKPSVEKWLQFIKSAHIVITDSFHALIFSILFKRKFIVIPGNISRFTRIENILKQLSLEERIFYSNDEVINDERWDKEINYDDVFVKIEKLRHNSVVFLENSLS